MDAKSVYKISYGLYVLTASEGDKDNGCIINTLIQLTSSPMQIAVTVNKANLTHDMIKNTGKFNVSVIDRTADFGLFRHFGFQSGREVQKFGTPDSYKFAPHYSDNGLLYVKGGTNAFMSGKVVREIDLGTHTMFIAAEIAANAPKGDSIAPIIIIIVVVVVVAAAAIVIIIMMIKKNKGKYY